MNPDDRTAAGMLAIIFHGQIGTAENMLRIKNYELAEDELLSALQTIKLLQAISSTPTGLNNPAPGCAPSATLGHPPVSPSNLERVASIDV